MKKISAAVYVWLLVSASFLLLVVGCSTGEQPAAEPARAQLDFRAVLRTPGDDELAVALEIYNLSPFPSADHDDITLLFEIWDREGELRAAGEIYELDSIPAESHILPILWRGKLDPGQYELTWGTPVYGQTQVLFEIVERDGWLVVGAELHRELPLYSQ